LLTKAIATEEKLADAHPAEDLLSLEGMDKDLAMELAVRGVITAKTWPSSLLTTCSTSTALTMIVPAS